MATKKWKYDQKSEILPYLEEINIKKILNVFK